MRSPGIELEILPQIVLHGDSDSGQAGRFESALFYLHSVMAGADVGEAVEAAASKLQPRSSDRDLCQSAGLQRWQPQRLLDQ